MVDNKRAAPCSCRQQMSYARIASGGSTASLKMAVPTLAIFHTADISCRAVDCIYLLAYDMPTSTALSGCETQQCCFYDQAASHHAMQASRQSRRYWTRKTAFTQTCTPTQLSDLLAVKEALTPA